MKLGQSICCVLATVTASIGCASPLPPAEILAGRWTYSVRRSHPVDPPLEISIVSGHLEAKGLGGGTADLTPLLAGQWRITRMRNIAEHEVGTLTLSGDRLHSAVRGTFANGSNYERNVTYRRDGHGTGVGGRWLSLKVNRCETWDGFIISVAGDGSVTWRIPTDLETFTGKIDGRDMVIMGPKGASNSTIAIKIVAPLRFSYQIKRANIVSEQGIIIISGDHRWLTELNWPSSDPKRVSKLVYKRTS